MCICIFILLEFSQAKVWLLGQRINAYVVLLDIEKFPFRGVVTFCVVEIPVFPQPDQESILSSLWISANMDWHMPHRFVKIMWRSVCNSGYKLLKVEIICFWIDVFSYVEHLSSNVLFLCHSSEVSSLPHSHESCLASGCHFCATLRDRF